MRLERLIPAALQHCRWRATFSAAAALAAVLFSIPAAHAASTGFSAMRGPVGARGISAHRASFQSIRTDTRAIRFTRPTRLGHISSGSSRVSGKDGRGTYGNGKISVNNGGDSRGGNTDGGRHPSRFPTWPHRPHWPTGPIGPIVNAPGAPTNVVTSPGSLGGGQGTSSPGGQVVRRSGSGVPPANERRYVPDEVVVEVASSVTDLQTDALARRHRLTRLQAVDFQLGATRLLRWRIADRRSVPVVVRALEADGGVISAQPNYLFALQGDAGSAAPAEGDAGQYVLDKMHLPQAHEIAKGDKVLVALINSGVDVGHPDLAGDIAGSFDAVGTGPKVHTHGTAIAGAIAAHGRLMGAAPAAQLLAVRAFSGTGADSGTTFAILSGLDWAVGHGARVINMSFAGPQDPGVTRGLAAAHEKGVVLVAAAGNKGPKSPPLYPAADPNVIAVTATDMDDGLLAVANRGRHIAVAAPGADLLLLAPDGAIQLSSGTSFAAAYVTGTVALMLQRRPDLLPDAARGVLAATARHLARDGADDRFGAGLVDAYAAVRMVGPVAVEQAATVTPPADGR